MSGHIKKLFDSETAGVKVDADFIKAASTYEREFVNKNEDHVTFLGGALMGTPPFVYTANDRHDFFVDIAHLDEPTLKQGIDDLPTVDKNHKVASDALNLTIMYYVHRLLTSNLPKPKIAEGCLALLQVMHYRFLSSLMHQYFKYPPNKKTMEATYYALNRKFSLKEHGSWAALIKARCEDIVNPKSIHYKDIVSFQDDQRIQYAITDSQGRIREVVKKMYKVFMEVHKNDSRVMVRKDHVELEGEMHVRDLLRDETMYNRYAHSTLIDRNTFVKAELTQVIANAVHTAPERLIVDTLNWMSDNYGKGGDKKIGELVDETLLHAFQYISANREELGSMSNLSLILTRLKALYTSSRTTDASVLKMRDLSYKITKKATNTKNSSLIASVRTAVLLYIVLRTFSMRHYS